MSIENWNIDRSWTLFLDRDGVINSRIMGGYVTRPGDFEFLPGVLDAIASFSRNFHRIIIVTNQQGIAKGLMTERNLLEVHSYMCDEIHKALGRIDKCFFAPNLVGDAEDLRKPGPAMAEMAKFEFPEIEFKRSVMIGDTDTDILFGKNLGMKTIRIRTEEPISVEADLTCESLIEFAKMM